MKTYNKNLDAASPLTLEQRLITQQNGIGRSFQKEYWDNKQLGLYVDVVSGKPLFASTTGWTAVPAVGRGRSPACPALHRYPGRNAVNLFIVGASVYPFQAG